VLRAELHNLYGPTEAAVDVTWWQCDAGSPLDTVPIGYPIANTEIHVLDPDLQRVPCGVAAELHIGGVQLARGYHNRPELTAEKFVPDPWSTAPGARLYKTGDLARHRPDGAIEFLGRLDHQIKIRGQRIELGEIEARIAEHAAVREVVVVASGTDAASTRLVAYVVADLETLGSPATAEKELSETCGVTLPSYMVPSVWMFLDALPLNANGKTDRSGLPAPQMMAETREMIAAESNVEAEVLALWRALLDAGPIGVTDAFFDVGGNSLLLIGLAQSLTDHFDRPTSVRELLRHSTVREQAELMARTDDEEDTVVAAAAAAADRRAKRGGRRRPRPVQD
jgi:non-ribosomal peptide synthetase component E (peptide arylation enzyme)